MARLLSGTLALGAVLALTTAFSCKTFDLPAETCSPAALMTRAIDMVLPAGSADCARCLEDHCCDAVGVCDRRENCTRIVSDTQFCVVGQKFKGASLEKTCAENNGLSATKPDGQLVNPEADSTYHCMRGECGAQCGLPVCKVDKAAPLILSAKCDECFAGGCCEPLNRCYENRACKLMVDCIIDECKTTLGPALQDGTNVPAESGDLDALCAAPAAVVGIPACIRSCLCRFRDNDQGLPPSDKSLLPVNLAASVYKCGKDAQCGADCAPPKGDAAAP